MKYKVGQTLVILSLSLLFFAYANFAPTALSSVDIADYVKNHFVREVLFGISLTVWTIWLVLQPPTSSTYRQIVLLGTIIIIPFWIASLFGWSTGGMEKVWGDAISPSTAYALHGSQVILFLIGILLLGSRK